MGHRWRHNYDRIVTKIEAPVAEETPETGDQQPAQGFVITRSSGQRLRYGGARRASRVHIPID